MIFNSNDFDVVNSTSLFNLLTSLKNMTKFGDEVPGEVYRKMISEALEAFYKGRSQ